MPEQISGKTYVTAAEAAAMLGWQPDSWTSKVSRGKAPQPRRRIAGRPLWLETDVAKFKRNMPGQGYRTDIHGTGARR